jgi:hypothetical protein
MTAVVVAKRMTVMQSMKRMLFEILFILLSPVPRWESGTAQSVVYSV